MNKLYIIFLVATTVLGCVSCNNEWEDEQFYQMASFKAQPNARQANVKLYYRSTSS